jgi:hypothetical protein
VFHAVLHDGRHAPSTDGGATWGYSAFDAYNGTVQYADGTTEDLRARPHVLVDEATATAAGAGTWEDHGFASMQAAKAEFKAPLPVFVCVCLYTEKHTKPLHWLESRIVPPMA